jgi:hypothetical protein
MKISNGIQLFDNVDDDKNTSDNNIKLETAQDDDLEVKNLKIMMTASWIRKYKQIKLLTYHMIMMYPWEI